MVLAVLVDECSIGLLCLQRRAQGTHPPEPPIPPQNPEPNTQAEARPPRVTVYVLWKLWPASSVEHIIQHVAL